MKKIVGILFFYILATQSQAQITLDGSLGPAGALSGPDYVIEATAGQQTGANLFHSFGLFNLGAQESATFTGPGSIENIIGRVTAGEPSSIDGTLRTTIPGANPSLFLLNPAGILFGPNARLDVQGSFYASTANVLRLGAGGSFSATDPGSSILTAAPPRAFGFLAAPAPISVQGNGASDDGLAVPTGRSLSLLGGDFTLRDGKLYAPSGQINISSVASAGEIQFADGKITAFDGFSDFATADISSTRQGNPQDESIFLRGDIDVGGRPGGGVFIRAGELTVDNSYILANSAGSEDGGLINIQAQRLALDRQSQIASVVGIIDGDVDFDSTGASSDIWIQTEHFTIARNSSIVNGTFSAGRGNRTRIDTNQLLLMDNADPGIVSVTVDTGASGDILINARDQVTIQNGDDINTAGGIVNNSFGPGDVGDIVITAPSIEIRNGFIQAIGGTSGSDSGDIRITAAERLVLRQGAQIDARVDSDGQGGNVIVDAGTISISGRFVNQDGDVFRSGLFSNSLNREAGGDAGQIFVSAEDLLLTDGGNISVVTRGQGNAGQIELQVNRLTLSRGSQITSSSESIAPAAGDAGKIVIVAQDVTIENSDVTTRTQGGGGGSIAIFNNRLVTLVNRGRITTSVRSGTKNAGDILIGQPIALTLADRGSIIKADADAGRGGNIQIVADTLLAEDPLNQITASSNRGIDGVVEVSAPDTDVSSGLVQLPAEYLDATRILNQGCATRQTNVGRFVIAGRGGLPAKPDTTLTASHPGGLRCNP